MFQIVVTEIIKVPGIDLIHISGINTKGYAQVGDKITDGSNNYEITSIPLIRRKDIKSINEIDICIRPGDYDPDELIAKTSQAV